MIAAYLDGKEAGHQVIGELPTPAYSDGEVLVRVLASSVMPTEIEWYPTFHAKDGNRRAFPIVMGHEFSGIVEEIGENVHDFSEGEAVYGLNDWFTNGAQAEYCVCAADSLAQKPKRLSHPRAAVVPISALTAWQALYERAQLSAGEHLLIHGAAGAVGSFAVQIARLLGAQVTATASGANLDFVRSLGADRVIDYQAQAFELEVQGLNVIFDTVGGETLRKSWPLLASHGRLVTVATPSASSVDQRARDAFLLVRADGGQLSEIAALIDDGQLNVHLNETFPLTAVNEAYRRASQGKLRGKVALRIQPEKNPNTSTKENAHELSVY